MRPSSLPKMAQCRCYEPNPSSSPAAERGTRIDAAIRAAWQGSPIPDDFPAEDRAAVEWALSSLRALSAGNEVTTEEDSLHTLPELGVEGGTMDAACFHRKWLADFKTGEIRDYMAQMAAYALSCMDMCFCCEWTAHLLFVDQRQMVTHHFTDASAAAIVKNIVDAPQKPTLCDYCSWCARRANCPAQHAAKNELMSIEESLPPCPSNPPALPDMLAPLLEDHAMAHGFLTRFSHLEKWVSELKTRLKDSIADDDPYFKRVIVSGKKTVHPLALSRYALEFGTDRILGMCSQIPLSKLEEQWKIVFPDKPIPSDLITVSASSVSLRLSKPKTK